MTEKLKPCPFCGGKAKYISTTEDMHWVYCRDCKCKTSEHYGYCGKEFSIGYWNTRANCKENLEVLSGHKTSPDEKEGCWSDDKTFEEYPKEKELIDPRVTPLTKEMVGKVVLVNGKGCYQLFDEWREDEYVCNVRGMYSPEGRYVEGLEDADDIKHYYWI